MSCASTASTRTSSRFKRGTTVTNRKAQIIAGSVFALIAIACGATGNIHKYTQAQLNSITTREVEADFDKTFKAAVDAMFDSGYIVATSDRNGGIITGTKKDDRSSERFWISGAIPDTQFQVSVLLREIDKGNTSVRLSMALNGEPNVDEPWIDNYWRLMKRQVMMKDPEPISAGAGAAIPGVTSK